MQTSFIYILTNKNKTTLYIGVTNNLSRRLKEHQSGNGSKFTKKYGLEFLVYFEEFTEVEKAISREKQLKNWSRIKKDKLIGSINPDWKFIDY
ncbi:MAG: GIY-YIG nuclease family protein [Bacteroidales bacterium]|nr:GIY-YIG nuclease family protein [Bacteroidales bacterium]